MEGPRFLILLTAVSAILGFAAFPACFLASGSRAPRPPATPPVSGPWISSGGQRIAVTPGDHPAARASAALQALGWTVADSTRTDEVLGLIHDNLAVVRWSEHGWWVRIEQHSDFRTHEQVPTWDQPWEALRVLHLIVPGAGPAHGWSALPESALEEQLQGESAESAYCGLLRRVRAQAVPPAADAGQRFRNHRMMPTQETEPAGMHLILHLTRAPLDRARLEGRLRAAFAGAPSQLLRSALLAMGRRILTPAVAAHADPYTLLDPLLRLGSDPEILEGAYARAFADEAALGELAALRDAGARNAQLSAATVARMRACAVPGSQALPDVADANGMVAAGAWLAAGGRAWLDGLVEAP